MCIILALKWLSEVGVRAIHVQKCFQKLICLLLQHYLNKLDSTASSNAEKTDICAMLPLPLVFCGLRYVKPVFHLDRIRGRNTNLTTKKL